MQQRTGIRKELLVKTVMKQDELECTAEDWQVEGAAGADGAGAGRDGPCSRRLARGRSYWCRWCWSRTHWSMQQRTGMRKELLVQTVQEQDVLERAAEVWQEEGAAGADGAGAGRD